MKASATAPSATESAERSPMEGGACTCGSEGPEACSCEIGELVRELTAIGWRTPDPIGRALGSAHARKAAQAVLARVRIVAIGEARRSWEGTAEDLAARLSVSAGRVRQIGGRL